MNNIPILLSLIAEPRIFLGYVNAYRQPVGCATLQVMPFTQQQIQPLQSALAFYFNNSKVLKSAGDILLTLGEIVCGLQQSAGLPIFDEIKITEHDALFTLWIPTLQAACYHQAMSFTIQLINYYAAQSQFVVQAYFSTQIEKIIKQLKAYAPRGSNSRRLLHAAHQANIPWLHLSQNIYQYGYGTHSRWLDSTFTDTTSQLGAKLARSKICTLTLLRKAGLPVPEQYIIQSSDEAVAKANIIGYPVVIKPYDQDGGKGVCAHLTSELRLRQAYEQARQFSEIVLLEKHVPGKDYRLLVLNGKLVWAVERMPPSVIGDGVHDIAMLIKLANEQSQRSKDEHATLKHLEITIDMTEYLREQDLCLRSVPRAGQLVQLNAVANISTGGVPVGVLDRVHPDNKQLIETAVLLMRLDLAGVDFIIADIAQSHLVVGGKIIEINSQPQLGTITAPHIYQEVLSTLVPNQGRIPIIVVYGDVSHDDFIAGLQQNLARQYQHIGIVKNNMAYLNGTQISHAPSLFTAANALMLNKQVEIMVCYITDMEQIATEGLAFDRYDYLFFLDSPATNRDFDLLATLFSACHNRPIVLENTLSYLMSLENINNHKLIVALGAPPSHSVKYPDFIEAIYLDAKELSFDSVHFPNSLLLALCLYLQTVPDMAC